MPSSILDDFNARSTAIYASVLITKDGLALASALPQHSPDCDEDRMSALSASIMHLGQKLMADFTGGGFEHIFIKGKKGNMLAIHDEDLALAVLTEPEAETGAIFSQMEQVVEVLRQLPCGLTQNA